jgi:hypothetical protein
MALDPTAREANVRDSLKKFFVDNLHPTYELTFDKGLTVPRVQGSPSEIDRWVSINFGGMERSDLSEHWLKIFCCTRKDNEGFKLAQLSDAVMGHLSDTTMTDGMKRIPLYRSYSDRAWELIGAMQVQEVTESQQYEASDETKFKFLNVRLRWSSKI